MSASVARAARLLEQLGFSSVLDYGYGMGEAAALDPARVEPLAAALESFSDDEMLGQHGGGIRAAVAARNDLVAAVGETVSRWPKS